MAFLDKTRIKVQAGSGGDGRVSFRREKFLPRGGPDGGDGGDGGDVVVRATTNVQDFTHLAGVHLFKAGDGGPGGPANRHGAHGRDVVIDVPVGAIVTDVVTGLPVSDLDALGGTFVAAAGGKGGRGNKRFATPTNQAPREAEEGRPGKSRFLELELKIIADIGLVGLPNAGKSTLLAKLSNARPKIADYPFTTLYPNVGVLEMEHFGRLIVADIPGLIEDAHRGVGLGDEFLRHVERTRVLLHVIDAAAADPVGDYRTLRRELEAYGRGVAEKTVLVAANKTDLPQARDGCESLRSKVETGVLAVSALTGEGVRDLVDQLKVLFSAGRP